MPCSTVKAFGYFLSRVSNFSRNKVRLATIANTSFGPNDQIVLEMPQGLIDLSTFTLEGRLSTAGGAAHGVYAPPVELQIDSISIEIGGVSVMSGLQYYGDLFNTFRQYQMADRYSFRRVLQNEQTQPVGGTASNYQCSNVPFAVYNWLGLLGSVPVLDTTILPAVRIYIRLASPQVLTVHAGNAATRSFSWTSVNALIDALDISDGLYYSLINQRLSQAPLEIPYDNYTTVVGSLSAPTQTTRFSTSTDCFTDVIAICKGPSYDSNVANSNTQLSSFFTRGGGDAGGVTLNTSWFSINGKSRIAVKCV